ncbi:MAG: acyltransferase [Anaerolineaceae bacterium]|nr:acyltransferase [Anaerolineaceae bacterium]
MKSNLTTQPAFHLGYHSTLDGLRGFAVLWVIAFHYELPFGRDGLFGVDIFFTLSGFLITVLLLEEWNRSETIHLKNFYMRRILRLYPALLLVLLFFLKSIPQQYFISTLFYFTNWVKALHLQPDSLFVDHTWSLSVEEQYYFLWPFVLLILLKIKLPKKLIISIPLFFGLASALMRFIVWTTTNDWFRVYMGTDLRADGLLLGSAFGLMTVYGYLPDYSKHKLFFSLVTFITVLFGVWLLFESVLTASSVPTFGILAVSLGTIILISSLVNNQSLILTKIFSFPPLVKIGVISYGLYLWHAPIGVIIDQSTMGWSPTVMTFIKLILTFIAASSSYYFLEKPILKLKNKFKPTHDLADPLRGI